MQQGLSQEFVSQLSVSEKFDTGLVSLVFGECGILAVVASWLGFLQQVEKPCYCVSAFVTNDQRNTLQNCN